MTGIEQLLERIVARFGLSSRDNWPTEVARAVAAIGERFGIDAEELLHRAELDPRILSALVSHLTVGESFFFRHPDHFSVLRTRLRRDVSGPRGRPYRILSLGCAGGEEAYSLAIATREELGARRAREVEILACDLSETAIARAKEARYSSWSLRGTSNAFRERYFDAASDEWILHDDIRCAVRFELGSIQSRLATLTPGSVGTAFFRNVGIYLTAEVRAEIFRELRRVLMYQGLLFVAPADPRPETGFHRLNNEATSIYVRECAPATPRSVSPPKEPSPSKVASGRVSSPRQRTSACRRSPEHAPPEAPRVEAAATAAAAATPESTAHLTSGREHLSAGRIEEAVHELRKATFLDPGHRLGRFWYGMALLELGDGRRAVAQLESLVASLRELSDERRLEDDEASVGELRAAAIELLEGLR